MALLLELFELARLELPRQLRQAEQRKALQGVRRKACGRDLPLARWARLPASGNGESELGDLIARRHPALDRIGRDGTREHDLVDSAPLRDPASSCVS